MSTPGWNELPVPFKGAVYKYKETLYCVEGFCTIKSSGLIDRQGVLYYKTIWDNPSSNKYMYYVREYEEFVKRFQFVN